MSKGYVEKTPGSKALPEDVLKSLQQRVESGEGPIVVRRLEVDVPSGPLEVRIECKPANGGGVMVGTLVGMAHHVFKAHAGEDTDQPYDSLLLLLRGETNPKRIRSCPVEAIYMLFVAKSPGCYVPIYARQ